MDSSSKSGPNPVGFSKWGKTLPARSASGYSKRTALEGSATKRTQTRDEGAQSQFSKRGKPNPVDIHSAHNNRLAQHLAKGQLRKMQKNPRKRGLIKLPWAAQRDSFRDALRSRRDNYEAARTRLRALISKKESETCLDPLRPEEVVLSVRAVDRDEKIRNASNVDTLVTSAVEAAVTSTIDVERVACGEIGGSTGGAAESEVPEESRTLGEAHQSSQSIQNRRSTALYAVGRQQGRHKNALL